MGSLKETLVLAVVQPTSVLACFQLCVHPCDALMQSDEPRFGCSYLLQVPPSLSRDELSACRVILLIELGLRCFQDGAGALRACRGVSSCIT